MKIPLLAFSKMAVFFLSRPPLNNINNQKNRNNDEKNKTDNDDPEHLTVKFVKLIRLVDNAAVFR